MNVSQFMNTQELYDMLDDPDFPIVTDGARTEEVEFLCATESATSKFDFILNA